MATYVIIVEFSFYEDVAVENPFHGVDKRALALLVVPSNIRFNEVHIRLGVLATLYNFGRLEEAPQPEPLGDFARNRSLSAPRHQPLELL